MTTIEKLDKDLKNAMQAKEADRVSVLRLVKSALKNAEISIKHELNESEVLSVLEKQAKQRRDSIELYTDGERPDLAEKEKYELDVIQSYLLEKMSEKEIEGLVDTAISELRAESADSVGQVIKEVMKKSAGLADGRIVANIVKSKLS